MADVTREELNARFETVDTRLIGAVDAVRLEFGAFKADVLLTVKDEIHRLRAWVLTSAIAALCSLLAFVVTRWIMPG
ncbi:MAG: hypothetical protein WBW32_07080 [Luteibacter sp.]